MTTEAEAHVGHDARDPDRAETEADRIRRVFRERDRRRPRHPAIVEAYRRVNAERLQIMATAFRPADDRGQTRLLDVGCGGGLDLAHWLAAGWPADRLAGTDLVPERIVEASNRCPGVDLRVVSGAEIPFAADTFDIVTAVTVLSSILDPSVRRQLFAEMLRVVRPGGSVLVYDFAIRKPWNRHVVAMDLPRLRALGGPPLRSRRLTPLLHLVALGTLAGPRGAALAMRLAPPTHRLTRWVRASP